MAQTGDVTARDLSRGVYTPDPSGTPALPPSTQSDSPPNYGYAYETVYSRWLPVMPSLVSPDGAHDVFMIYDANRDKIHNPE
jgi:hypothetical protein